MCVCVCQRDRFTGASGKVSHTDLCVSMMMMTMMMMMMIML